MKNKQWYIWNKNKYIGTINYDSYYKRFTLILPGFLHSISFDNSDDLEDTIKDYVCGKVVIPNHIKDEIDSIAIMNLL